MPACECAPGIHTSSVVVLSDDGAIWSFDPAAGTFAFVRDVPEALACAIAAGQVTDECGGDAGAEVHQYLGGPCSAACMPSPSDRVSKVSRLDLANPGASVVTVVPEAPIRVVGAGTSVCAPTVPE